MIHEPEITSWNGSNNERDCDEEFDWQVEEEFEYDLPWNAQQTRFDNDHVGRWRHIYERPEPPVWFW